MLFRPENEILKNSEKSKNTYEKKVDFLTKPID